jgi:hypothetical protein
MPPIDLVMIFSTTLVPAVTTAITSAANNANAIRACGSVAWLEPDDFQRALSQSPSPSPLPSDGSLVFHSERGRSRARHEYLASHRGLFLYTKSDRALRLPTGCHEMAVKSIWKSST